MSSVCNLSRITSLAFVFGLSACGGGGPDSRSAPTEPSLARGAREASSTSQRSTASVAWNEIARNYVASLATKPNQQANLRIFTYLALAQYDAVVAAEDVDREKNDDGDVDDDSGNDDRESVGRPSPRAAAEGASVAVLSFFFPEAAATFESALRAQAEEATARHTGHSDFAAGEAIGRAVGAKVIASSKTDRFDAVFTGSIPAGACFWTGTNPLLPLLGQMRTFFLRSGSQFRSPPPPTCTSAEFRAALAEVRHISDTRTPEQLAIAQFWAMTTGSLVAGFWNGQVSDLVTRHRLNERRAAHALAFTNMTAMDANIACHDGKYTYWLIRPFQADVSITTPIGRPNHPSYPSNHACVSGAFAYALGALLHNERARLAAMADQAGESRIFAGIHYRFDKDAGLRLAQQVTRVALRHDVHGHTPFPIR